MTGKLLTIALVLAAVSTAQAAAARALVQEFMITTQRVSSVESNVFEVAYQDALIVTSGCWVSAYNDDAVITNNQIIFIDRDEVCQIMELRAREP